MIPLSHLPDYFSERGWKSPDDAYNGPFQYAMRTDLHMFDYLATKPKLQQAFTTTMTLSHRRRGAPWYTYFPTNEKLSNALPSDILLVDVGGGQGDDLVAFKKAHPELSGRLILQDLPAVISVTNPNTLSSSGIEAIPHNFFHPQPIKNARCYYLRTVIHDWPDSQALEILGHIKEVMGSEGVLLIEENVVSEEGMSLESGCADLTMMVCFASMERRLVQWRDLLGKAGLRLEKVWKPEGQEGSGTSALLEAVRDDKQSTKTREQDA